MTTFLCAGGAASKAKRRQAGSESRIPMGVAIVGGLVVGTPLTLFAVPAVYTYFTYFTRRSRPGALDLGEAA